MKNHLFVGTWTKPGAIFAFEFDDVSLELKLANRNEVNHDEPSSWMTFDHQRKNIYGASMKTWSSYSIQSPTVVTHSASLPITGHPSAVSPSTNTRAVFVLAAKKPPYNVYGNLFFDHAGFGNILSVTPAGALKETVQNCEYQPDSGVHGMVFDSTETYLYSADLHANKIWTHKKDSTTGHLALVSSCAAPAPGDGPRWVVLHPNDKYLYVLMEHGNRLATYVIDDNTHLPVFTHATYPLIPPGFGDIFPRMYRSDVCALSSSSKYLFATARSNSPALTGYIAAFRLDAIGRIERQLCLNPTPTSGGHSNAVTPSPWTDEWLALTDDEQGWLEIYRWHDEFLGRVAHLDVKEPGFGMNAHWFCRFNN